MGRFFFMKLTPRFLVCDPLPSEVDKQTPEYILDTELCVLWAHEDDGSCSVVEWLNEPLTDTDLMRDARCSCKAWLERYHREEEDLYE